jgi:4-amino-4-deoxy-L-arabinose transferase-like glycosyltransferase
MIETGLVRKYRYEVLLAGVLILSAFLNLWNIWNQGYSNAYYAAAVKSMLANPSLLFFNSFDAAGFITVDKPPVGLWVQAASAAIFGFSGWSLVLPQALAGIGSVALLYLIVSRAFGKPAGLVSALALAITPIFVAVSRNGTMDGVLIFVLLLAVWAGLKAAHESSLP